MLILFGLAVLSSWAIYTYITLENLILLVASIPLSWGIILLALYLSFRKLDWKWWK
jgi:hypothetical protein